MASDESGWGKDHDGAERNDTVGGGEERVQLNGLGRARSGRATSPFVASLDIEFLTFS